MSRRLPRNGDALLGLREGGMRPSGLVLVSLVGPLGYDNFTLYGQSGIRYDWRCVAGLEVDLTVSCKVPFGAVLATLADIVEGVPAHLTLSYVEGPRIDCGQARFAGRMAFDWYPQAVGPFLAAGAQVEKQLRHQLGCALPLPYDAAVREIQRGSRHH